jgi:myo-inositol 2-dehydrogenase / D-chiro-inositol 1-dehydrogenase
MSRFPLNRREFVTAAASLAAAANLPFWLSQRARAEESKNDRPIFGCIGLGGQGTFIAKRAKTSGADVVAVCDVDRYHAEEARDINFKKAEIFEDYRKLLDRKDIEAVTIGTPDHWHTKIALAALDAGKHVYCEKPLTLTIDEGKLLVAAVKRSGKTFQVGTQQRSDKWELFGRAVATVRSGQLGKIKNVIVHLPISQAGGPFPAQPIPDGLNWDFWQGQAPLHDYCPERCHHKFRWWYDYAGGIMTDWGAHHTDIVQWALGTEDTGPVSIDGSQTELPNIPGGYTTPKSPIVHYQYASGITMTIRSEYEGVTFEGEKGRIFVNRGRITGKPIEEQDADPALKEKIMGSIQGLFKGNVAQFNDPKTDLPDGFRHMHNFFEGFKHNLPVISDVESQHRTVSICHLGNISIRLQRKIEWEPDRQQIVGDGEANAMLRREQRAPYQIPSSA